MYYKKFRHNFFRNIKNNKMSKYYLLILLVLCVFIAFTIQYLKEQNSTENKDSGKNETHSSGSENQSSAENPTDTQEPTANDVVVDNTDNYIIRINSATNRLYVYKVLEDDNTELVRACICSVSTYVSQSDNLSVSDKYIWRPINDYMYCQYATKIASNIVIQSMPYDGPNKDRLYVKYYNNLGNNTSDKGAVYLTVEDAMWIYNNVKKNAKAVVYSDPNEVIEKTPEKLPEMLWCIRWDPTDPDTGNVWTKQHLSHIEGVRNQTVSAGQYFDPLEGVTVYDTDGKPVPSKHIIIDGILDTSTPGEYQITYVIADIYGENIIWDCVITVV